MLTSLRMVRYGVNNFSRNAWLTVAATAVMTITLLIVFTTFAARGVLVDTVSDISSRIDMSIYLKNDVREDDVATITNDLESLSNVQRVRYISPEDARRAQVDQQKGDQETLQALSEATNRLPATVRISLHDINDVSQLNSFVDSNQVYIDNRDTEREPSFAGERRQAIENITKWVSFAERIGGIATLVFIVISALIVFNTIRMAIFNRKEEIAMMKLIGADRNFIRGPFIVEASMYGFVAGVVATILGVVLLYAVREPLVEYGLPVATTINDTVALIGLVLLGMIILGILIGVISSYFATRKYLKI